MIALNFLARTRPLALARASSVGDVGHRSVSARGGAQGLEEGSPAWVLRQARYGERWRRELVEVGLPDSGKKDTLWDLGFYPLSMEFSEDYPSKPPWVQVPEGFFHPNIYPSGTVCPEHPERGRRLAALDHGETDLAGRARFAGLPNPASPAQSEAYMLFTNDRVEYDRKVKQQALRYPPPS